jgi:carbamoyl-phosphate synthase large subunit
MQFLQKQEISYIYSISGNQFNKQIEYPIFVKPISGRGSKGARTILSREQLDAYYKLESYDPKDILIQPLIKGTEYTVGVLINNLNNILSISSKRIISKKGITQIAITENNSLIDQIVYQVVEKMKPCGPINIQLIIDEFGEVKIFEINPRFSTTSILEIEGGINLISKYIEYYDKEYLNVPLRPLENLTIHRRWENVFYND